MKNFLVIDFEFTTYNKPVGRPSGFFSEIIEIGAVKLDGVSLESTGEMQNFVKPRFYPKQAKESMDFCMITDKDMKNGLELPQMVAKLGELYEAGNTYFVSWGPADFTVLDVCCNRHKIENPVKPEDCLDLAAAYKLMKGDNYTTGLKAACEEQDVDTAGLWHTAFDDANNTAKLLRKLIEKGWKPEEYLASLKE